MNAKWTIDFRVRAKPKLLEEKNWRKSLRPQVRQPFLRYMNKSTVHIRKKKLDFIKMKMFCTSKYSMKELKTSNRLRKILANPIKDLYWDYILIHLEKHLKWAKYLNSNFIQKRYANDWYSHEKMATSLTEASSCCPLMWEQHVLFRSRLTTRSCGAEVAGRCRGRTPDLVYEGFWKMWYPNETKESLEVIPGKGVESSPGRGDSLSKPQGR